MSLLSTSLLFVLSLLFLLIAPTICTAPDDAFLISCARGEPACAPIWAAPVPPTFSASIPTPFGPLLVHVNTSLAPSHAARFYVLTQLRYYEGGPFYRVLRTPQRAFVAQLGYRGVPSVDTEWLALRLSNATCPVRLPNARGTLAFGTGEVPNDGSDPSCTAPLCSRGFSVELYINLGDNAAELDAMGFSPFGVVADMTPADKLYAKYGELADLCSVEAPPSAFCVKKGAGWAGVNLTRFLAEGNEYVRKGFPSLSWV